MKRILLVFLVVAFAANGATARKQPKEKEVPVKNIIYMIGDGMGLAHFSATSMFQNYEPLNIERAQYVGIQKTYSANNRVTDSAASGTALATGVKTYNGAIGLDVDKNPVENILEKADRKGMSTGLVATYAVTHATPAAFIGHVQDRGMEEDIAEYFVKNDIDVFLGGGHKFFNERKDGRDLTKELEDQGYTMIYDVKDMASFKGDKLGGLFAHNAMPKMNEGRGDYLPQATEKALEILSQNKKGFFVMIEGSMIDNGGHANDIKVIVDETVDFDKAVKVAMDFADRNPGTLVVITADHETGGLTLPSGKPDFSLPDQGVEYKFSTWGHTGTFIPIYAYGAGARNFSGVMENVDIPKIMMRLLGVE